ncbi:hypothetical protein F5B21DRAFT_184248 [Xylaria acuta]|nr:hypothetical protein F5B21DRAFT_184248 [Xylaria acuta]
MAHIVVLCKTIAALLAIISLRFMWDFSRVLDLLSFYSKSTNFLAGNFRLLVWKTGLHPLFIPSKGIYRRPGWVCCAGKGQSIIITSFLQCCRPLACY